MGSSIMKGLFTFSTSCIIVNNSVMISPHTHLLSVVKVFKAVFLHRGVALASLSVPLPLSASIFDPHMMITGMEYPQFTAVAH